MKDKKVIIIGPPGSGKSTISPILASKLGVPHIRTSALMESEVRAKTPEGLEYKEWRRKYKPEHEKGKVLAGPHIRTPAQMFIKTFLKHFGKSDGWVLERGPKQPSYFELYKSAGIYPDKVICLQLDEEESLKRIQNRRLDPVTGLVYNSEEPKEEKIKKRLIKRKDDQEDYIKSRLEGFTGEGMVVVSMYPPEMVKYVDANQSVESIIDEILSFLQ